MGAGASDYFTAYSNVQYGFLDAELAIENFHELAAKGLFHEVSICLKKGLDPNGRVFPEDDEYEREDTPIICCARGKLGNKGRKRHLKTLDVLLKFGAHLDDYNVLEQTALYVACDRNLLNIATWLVEHGANVNKCSKAGESPLLCATRNHNAEMVKLLLDHGAQALQPQKAFSCLQFPIVVEEARKAAAEAPQVHTAAQRPRRRRGPPAKSKTAEQEVQEELEKRFQQESETRNKKIQEIEDRRFMDEQKPLREKQLLLGTRRRQLRRKNREKEQYLSHLAKIEKKQEELENPLAVKLGEDDSETDDEPNSKCNGSEAVPGRPKSRSMTREGSRQLTQRLGMSRPNTTSSQPAQAVELVWVRSSQLDSRGRAQWSATELRSTNNGASTLSLGKDASSVLMNQCQDIYRSLQNARNRRMRLVHTAPDAELYRQSHQDINVARGSRFARPETAP